MMCSGVNSIWRYMRCTFKIEQILNMSVVGNVIVNRMTHVYHVIISWYVLFLLNSQNVKTSIVECKIKQLFVHNI